MTPTRGCADNSTDGSIWTYNISTKKYKDTGDDMAVPISNYTVVVLQDNTGVGLYTFGGRDNDGASLDKVQVYYPATGTSKVIKSDPWPGKTPSDCISLPATGVAVESWKIGATKWVAATPFRRAVTRPMPSRSTRPRWAAPSRWPAAASGR